MLVLSVVVFLFSFIQNKNFCIQKKAPHSTTTTQTEKKKKKKNRPTTEESMETLKLGQKLTVVRRGGEGRESDGNESDDNGGNPTKKNSPFHRAN
jgi:hypothetical protein